MHFCGYFVEVHLSLQEKVFMSLHLRDRNIYGHVVFQNFVLQISYLKFLQYFVVTFLFKKISAGVYTFVIEICMVMWFFRTLYYKLFKVFAILWLLSKSSPVSSREILHEFIPLSEKYGLVVFQNFI